MAGSVTPWVSQTHPIEDGEEVRQRVANRLPTELGQRTQYLKDRLDQIQAGKALVLRDVAMSSTVSVGHAIYWDSTAGVYKPALAKVEFNAAAGGYTIAASSYVVGICSNKTNDTLGDLLMLGVIEDFDFTNGAGVTGALAAHAGAYYLSSSQPGKYTKQRPPIGVYVMFMRGDGLAHVNPTPREVLESHIHYVFDLYAQPSGTLDCIESGDTYTFSAIDATVPGWLPVSEFTDPPVDAVYGYNMDQHDDFKRIWPPVPIEYAYLEIDGVGADPALYTMDSAGLWWNNECYSKGPWPTQTGCPTPPDATPCTSSTLEEMGFVRHSPNVMRMRLYFSKMIFKTNASVVTSLAPAAGSPIQVLDCDGNPGTKGDLKLSIDLGASVTAGDLGYLALKSVSNFAFTRGPVLTGLRSGSSNVQISIAGGRGISQTDGEGVVYRGDLILSVTPDGSLSREGSIELIALNGVREESLLDPTDSSRGIFFLGMAKNTSLTGRVSLPFSGLPANPIMSFYFWLLARANSVALPAMEMGYKTLTRPVKASLSDACTTPQALASTFTALADLDPTDCSPALNSYIEITSDEFPIYSGLTTYPEVYFSLARSLVGDLYPAEVGILRMGFTIRAGP